MPWLESQKENSAETKKKIQDISSEIEDISLVNVNVPIHPGEIVATAEPLLSINSDEWIQPLTNTDGSQLPLELGESEGWYQVQISQFYDGKSIRKEPFNDLRVSSVISAQYLWKILSLDSDPRILITVNLTGSEKQQSILAVIKAAKIEDGKLYVLASGEKLASE
jgi:predicted restriction endonuclease